MRWRSAPTMLGLGFVAAILAVLFLPHGDWTVDASSYSVVRPGYRLSYELLGELGYDVHRFHHGIEELPDGATVWLLEPASTLLDEGPAGMGGLADWVSEGNTLLLGFGGYSRSFGDRVLDQIEERQREQEQGREQEQADPEGRVDEAVDETLSPWEEQEILSPRGDPAEALATLGLSQVRILGGRTPLDVGFDDPLPVTSPLADVGYLRGVRQAPTLELGELEGEVLVEARDGPLVWRVPHGAGQVVLLSDARLLCNWGLAGADNGTLLVWLAQLTAGEGPILFEEFSHGYTTATTLPRLVLKPPMLFVTVQVLLVLAVLVGWRAWRFGPMRPAPRGDRRDKAEHVEALADLHHRGHHAADAARRLRAAMMGRLRERLGYGPGLTEQELLRALGARSGMNPEALANDLALPPRLDPRSVLQYARRLELIRRRIEE